MKKVNGLEKEENNMREISLGSLFDGIGGSGSQAHYEPDCPANSNRRKALE